MIHLNSSEVKITEKIMKEIKDYIKVKPTENHNYTLVYEKIYYVLRTIHCARCNGATFVMSEK